MSQYGEGMLYWVCIKISGSKKFLGLIDLSKIAGIILEFGCNLHSELLNMCENFRKTTRDVMEEMWDEEQECDNGPPDMPDFSKVPDFPSSDDEGAIQPTE